MNAFKTILILFVCLKLSATTYTWNAGNGNWSTSTNWTPNGVPNSSADTAIFNTRPTITLDGNFDIGSVTFNNDNSSNAIFNSGQLSVYNAISVNGEENFAALTCNSDLSLEGMISVSIELFPGNVVGTGGITVLGNGLVNLTGNSTYSGDTIVEESGTLTLYSPTAPLGSLPNSALILHGDCLAGGGVGQEVKSLTSSQTGVLDINGNFQFGDASSTTYLGNIKNDSLPTGTLTKQGSGTFSIMNAITYEGDVAIAEGTIAVSNNLSLGSGRLSMANGTTLAISNGISISNALSINNAATATVNVATGLAALSGSSANTTGVLSKTGSGILVLSGANQHSGGTNLTAGAIVLQSSSGLGTGTLAMTDGTTLALSNNVAASNPIALATSGVGTLDVSNGTATLSGAISGTGSNLTKTGAAVLILTGSSLYNGDTTVSGGTLTVNGNISNSSSVVVQSGAILKGTGMVCPLTLNAGATLYPGNSIGTLTAESATFNPSSIFQIEINPSTSSLLNVTGAASLAGTVNVVQNTGSYSQNKQYLILTADSISGSFNQNATGGIPGHPFFVIRVGNSIYLSYDVPLIGASDLSINSLTGNALTIANYLNQNSDTAALILLNPLTGNTLQSALENVCPSRNAFISYANDQTAFSMNHILRSRLDSRLFSRRAMSTSFKETALVADASGKVSCWKPRSECNTLSGWVTGFGGISHQKAADQNPAFDFISEAFLAGVDYQWPTRSLAGASIGYFHSNLYYDQSQGHSSVNTLFTSLYAAAFIRSFYISAAIWVFGNDTDSSRRISFPGFSQTAQADISSLQVLPHIEIGYEQLFDWGSLIPFSSFDWVVNFQDSYTESGAAPFNASQGDHTSSMLRSETGLKIAESWMKSWGDFIFSQKLSYVYLNPYNTGVMTASYAGTPGQFTVYAVNHVQNIGALGLDFLFLLGDYRNWSIDLNYEGEYGTRYWTNQASLTLSKDF